MPARRFALTIAVAALALLALGVSACGDSSDETGSAGSEQTDTSAPAPDPAVVRAHQAALNAVGCYTGAVDGVEGPATTAGTKAFQAAVGLTADGVIGEQTTAALNEAVGKNETVCTSSGSDGTPGGGTVTLTSASYNASFTVQTCTNNGETDLVLTGENSNSLQISVNVPNGSGSLGVTGGTEEDGITLNGNVTSLQVGDAGNISASGTFTGANLAGEDFTLSGSCA